MQSIQEIVRDAEDNFLRGSTQMSEYVEWDMHNTIETIDAYLNSKHISGPTDSLNREKPFFNIVTAATNIWYRATDLDRKDIRIMPENSHQVGVAFIATVIFQNWMKEMRFGAFLNEWGRSLARYGSSVVKFVEKGGDLTPSVIPWNRLIVDPLDFDALPRIEKIYKTPAQLQMMTEYDQDVVEALIAGQSTRETLDGHKQDNQSNFIELYEVHGLLPEYLLDDDPQYDESDEVTYRQQMHVVSFTQTKDGFDDYTLFKGKEKKDPYMITHLIKEDGRTLAIGAVEYLFDAQWMVNHSQKNIKDTLDIASKLIFQTSDGTYLGRNVLNAIETGDILIHHDNKPLTQLNNSKPDITAQQNFGVQWQQLANEITSTPDAIKGNTLPSGTPYSLGAYLGSQANSLFEIMTENKGIHVTDMMREFILDHIAKKMDTKEEIVAILESNEIAELDAMYVPRKAINEFNKKAKEDLIAGVIPEEFNQASAEQEVRSDLAAQGNKRFFKPDELDMKTWKEALKDFNMTAIVEVTNENSDKQAVMQTLASLYTTMIQTDPVNANVILGRIMTETGVFSPLQITTAQAQPNLAQTPPSTGGADALSALAQ